MTTHGNSGAARRGPLQATTAAALAVVAMFGLGATAACSKAASVKAMMTFKEANKAYQGQDYKRSAPLYEETVKSNPDMPQVYFFLGNSYDNLYKPGVQEPANDELLHKAVANYQLAAEKLSSIDPNDAKLRTLALQYLMAAYGTDKLNDPVKAEPIVIRLIQLDPGEPANYFALAKLYEDAGEYEAAEKALLMAKGAKPSDAGVYMQLAGFYNRQGEFEKTISELEQRASKEPSNPEAFQTIATFYWDEAYRDTRLKEQQKKDYVQKGIQAVDHAIQIKNDYMEAIVYKGLLLRLQANLEKDPKKQQDLLKEATQLQEQAEALRKKKAAGLGD